MIAASSRSAQLVPGFEQLLGASRSD